MVKTTAHVGKKIERIRTIRGIKQETLANALGISQTAVSRLEQSETIEDDKLKAISDALGVSIDAIKNFDEDDLVSRMNNIYDNHFDNNSINAVVYNQLSPIEKIVELYERLLDSERKRNEQLESMLKDKK